MASLKGKVAVVTGASKGIGAGVAKALAGAGAAVVVNSAWAGEGAGRVVGEIPAAGGRAVAVKADVSSAAEVKRLFEEAHKSFGRLDVLVNNAGIYKFDPLEAVTEAEFHRQFNTNVLGLILATQEAAKRFGPAGGSVINVGSVVSTFAPPGAVVYAATKGAVDTVTRVLARELGPRKIRVNSINPGGVETEGTHTAGIMGSDFERQAVAGTPLGRFGKPNDIAPIAVFLAGDEAGWLTGEHLVASGGFR